LGARRGGGASAAASPKRSAGPSAGCVRTLF
jgi:hypothetical protein